MIQPVNVQNPCNVPVLVKPMPTAHADYNAVKITINGATVNQPAVQPQAAHVAHGDCEVKKDGFAAQGMPSCYNYPQANLYDYPQAEKQVYYAPVEKLPFNYAPAAEDIAKNYCTCPTCGTVLPPKAIASQPISAEVPQPQAVIQNTVSTPVIQPQVMQQNINYAVASAPAPVITEAVKEAAETNEKEENDVAEKTSAEAADAVVAEETPKVEVKKPEELKPQIDINAFIAELTNPDFNKQALAMEAIALLVKQDPEKASELLDQNVIDALKGIMTADTEGLIGPTKEQTEARIKILQGKEVTDTEKELAKTITPLEQAERNKNYSLFTMAILEKLFGEEVEKLSGQVVPFKDIPGIMTVVEQMSSNPNPSVRTSALEALYYMKRPEYKDDLNALFKIALNDSDQNVRNVAQAAIDSLNKA